MMKQSDILIQKYLGSQLATTQVAEPPNQIFTNQNSLTEQLKLICKGSDQSEEPRQDCQIVDQFNVYERLYSLHACKPKPVVGQLKKMAIPLPKPAQSESIKQKERCDRLYQKSQERSQRQKDKAQRYEMQLKADSAKLFCLNKSSKLAREKVAKDIGKVMEVVDKERTGKFTLQQTGECLLMLRVVNFMFDRDLSQVNQERSKREQEFTIHLWCLLNPFRTDLLEIRFLYTFLKLVYDPYNDGSQEKLNQLIEEATKLVKDIKQLQRELVQDPESYVQSKQLLENDWSVEQVIREMYELSGNFKEYLRGNLRQLFIPRSDDQQHPELSECTFRPAILDNSVKIDARQTSKSLAGKIVRKSDQGSFELVSPKNRVDLMMKKHDEVEKKKETIRKQAIQKELENCTFRPQLVSQQDILGERYDSGFQVVRPKTTRNKNMKPSWQIKEEQELQKCTFSPDISKSRVPLGEQNSNLIVGFSQTVNRMRQADQERKCINETMETKFSGKMYTGKPTVQEPFTFELQSKKEVILKVEITVPPNRVTSLVLRKDDSIEKEVSDFANKWQLSKATQTQVYNQIVQHLIQSTMYRMTREGRQDDQNPACFSE